MSSYPQYPQYPQQPKKTKIWPWILGGCAFLIFGFIGFIAFIFFIVNASMRASEPYQTAVARARSDARVIEALGTPIGTGTFIWGSIHAGTESSAGNANLNTTLRGPKGKATLYVVATKQGGRWSYSTMTVTPGSGPAIDLLNEESASTAPPGG